MTEKPNRVATLEHMPLAFILVMGLLLIALGWLGWLLLAQDRSLQQERERQRVDLAADHVLQALDQRIVSIHGRLDEMARALAGSANSDVAAALGEHRDSMIAVHMTPASLTVVPGTALHYVPPAFHRRAPAGPWAEADRLEFARNDSAGAMRVLEPLLASSESWVRAGARTRLGRIRNRIGDTDGALHDYARLAEYDSDFVETVPAPWLAHYARSSIFAATGEAAALSAEAERLAALLHQGGHRVSKSTYSFYAQAANRWLGENPKAQPEVPLTRPVSEALAELRFIFEEWQRGHGAPFGVRLFGPDGSRLVVLWRIAQTDLLGGLLRLADFESDPFQKLAEDLAATGIGWSISEAGGGRVLVAHGGPPLAAPSTRTTSLGDTALLVEAFSTPEFSPLPEDILRRRLLLAGLALILLVILASTYFTFRALRREAEISALQADFVSAVSHEFRTPLTSIRQLTEMLASERYSDPDKIPGYYRILDRESSRLQRMVEDLLDFGRMEAGAKTYHPETLDMALLLPDIMTEFRQEYELDPDALQLETGADLYVRIDRGALTRAIWNLLDNAVKYSSGKPRISVRARRVDAHVVVEVSDEGIGIEPEDQQRVFEKFVRGASARRVQTKGTGLGLAMVRKIIEDHGGTIQLRSTVGEGSTLTVSLEAVDGK
jgi:signal transduction histidine kinase